MLGWGNLGSKCSSWFNLRPTASFAKHFLYSALKAAHWDNGKFQQYKSFLALDLKALPCCEFRGVRGWSNTKCYLNEYRQVPSGLWPLDVGGFQEAFAVKMQRRYARHQVSTLTVSSPRFKVPVAVRLCVDSYYIKRALHNIFVCIPRFTDGCFRPPTCSHMRWGSVLYFI